MSFLIDDILRWEYNTVSHNPLYAIPFSIIGMGLLLIGLRLVRGPAKLLEEEKE